MSCSNGSECQDQSSSSVSCLCEIDDGCALCWELGVDIIYIENPNHIFLSYDVAIATCRCVRHSTQPQHTHTHTHTHTLAHSHTQLTPKKRCPEGSKRNDMIVEDGKLTMGITETAFVSASRSSSARCVSPAISSSCPLHRFAAQTSNLTHCQPH